MVWFGLDLKLEQMHLHQWKRGGVMIMTMVPPANTTLLLALGYDKVVICTLHRSFRFLLTFSITALKTLTFFINLLSSLSVTLSPV